MSSAHYPAKAKDRPGPHEDSLLRQHLGDRRFVLTLPRAIALQALHPAIGAALAEHASSRLWHHKKRTVSQMIYLVYSGRDAAPVIRNGHEHLRGVDGFGRRYHALHPEIFLFQHATYVDALVHSVEVFGGGLSAPRRERLYAECCAWFRGHGISDRHLPVTWPEFIEYFEQACATTLTRGPHADALASQVLRPDAWLPRRVPSFAVRALLHPRAAELFDSRPDATDRHAFTAYAAAVRTTAALSSRRRRYLLQTRVL
ncbi:oxygenase MpaB family protein [Nocardia sp. NPDC048505]|uniref:oxygenase MpaB family protein n=1 Tax=unclassified Nocardia TaxID=2637762 RepID=UPI0033EAF746